MGIKFNHADHKSVIVMVFMSDWVLSYHQKIVTKKTLFFRLYPLWLLRRKKYAKTFIAALSICLPNVLPSRQGKKLGQRLSEKNGAKACLRYFWYAFE